MKTILVIPDTHARPGVDFGYLTNIGKYIVDKRPDIIVHLGDHWDMPSLSGYDIGKRQYEGRRYLADIQAGNIGIQTLLAPLEELQARQKRNKERIYNPYKVFCLGNHEQRIQRAVDKDAKLDGILGYKDLDLVGWEVYDFLEVFEIEDVAFSHYFVSGQAGKPCSTANAQLNKKHQSCIAGHQQGRQVATAHKANGEPITAIIAGSAYPHEEEYLGRQGNKHWRGIVVLHEVESGSFDEMFVSLRYLKQRYEP